MQYVMSDIHGNLLRFCSIMQQISLRPEDTLYVLGDVSDRHPDGITILRYLMKMPNVRMLLGNHEYMMLRAIGHPYDGPEDTAGRSAQDFQSHWYHNGGEVTHRQWKQLSQSSRDEILEYLLSLPLQYSTSASGISYLLAHAAPEELYPQYGGHQETLTHFCVWNRDVADLPVELPGGATLITGHTPTSHFQDSNPLRIWSCQNHIAIDCGSGFPGSAAGTGRPQGRLACLRLDDLKEYYSLERV